MAEGARGFFNFLELPAELRTQIYRYLLASDYVAERKANPKYWDIGWMVFRHDPELQPPRCQNMWIESSAYAPNILRVSRQVYQESSAIFSVNSWIFVRVNKAGFAEDLRRRGYDAISVNYAQGVKISMLVLSIHFLHLASSSQSDTFVISSKAAVKLQTALFVLGERKIKLSFTARQDFPKQSNDITTAFSQLRHICTASVCGPGSQHSLGLMARTISTRFDSPWATMEFVKERLRNSLSVAQKHWDQQNLYEAVDECVASVAYIWGCVSVYDWETRMDPKGWGIVLAMYTDPISTLYLELLEVLKHEHPDMSILTSDFEVRWLLPKPWKGWANC